MRDIVERLRQQATERRLSQPYLDVSPRFYEDEAADEIESLRRRIAELEAVIRSHNIPIKTATGRQAHYCTGEAAPERYELPRCFRCGHLLHFGECVNVAPANAKVRGALEEMK